MGLLTAKMLFSEQVIGYGSGAAYDDLEIPKIGPSQALEVRHVSVENRTNAYTRLILGPAQGAWYHYKEDFATPAANVLSSSTSRIWVTSGWVFRARLVGCTAKDNLILNIEGILYQLWV